MSVEASIARELRPYGIQWEPRMPDEHPLVTRWLERASAAWIRPTADTLGVVILSHGADRIWNEEIRRALEPVAQQYDWPDQRQKAIAKIESIVERLRKTGKRVLAVERG